MEAKERIELTDRELKRLELIIQQFSLSNKKVLTMEEATLYTGRSRSNLHKLTSTGAIPHSKPCGKMIYFDRHLLDEWMLQNPIKAAGKIEEEAATYVITNPPTPNRAIKRGKNNK